LILTRLVAKMAETLQPASARAGKPDFLTSHAPTWGRRRLTPLSRVPKTARLGDVWHTTASQAGSRLVTVDRPADIDPDGAVERAYAGWAALVDDAAAWLHAAGVLAPPVCRS
jgi:hypothetical protein